MTPKDYIFSGLLLISLVFGTVQTVRLANKEAWISAYQLSIKDEMIKKGVELIHERNATEKAQAEIGNKYFEGVNDANRLHDATIARLNADNSQLQKHWRSALRRADSAEAALTGVELDAASAAVSGDIANLLRGSAKGDATIVSLQDTINTYLCQINKEPYPGYSCSPQ